MRQWREAYKQDFGVYPEDDPELMKPHDYNCVGCGRDIRDEDVPKPPHLYGEYGNKSQCHECYTKKEGKDNG